MAFFDPDQLDFSEDNIALLIQGAPGTGKSTLGYSAPDAVTVELDHRGIKRVPRQYLRKTIIANDFGELKRDIESAKGKFKTVIIDTGGGLVEMLKKYVVDNPQEFKGGSKNMGGISQQGYGYVKKLWNDFADDLRRNFNVVFIFHETLDKNDDGGVFYQIVCEGSARTTVYQSCDLAARLFIQNGQRYLGFTPTEFYSAKSSFGISGLVPVPELKEGDTNDFITKLFEKVRKNIRAESETLRPEKTRYEAAMVEAREFINNVEKPEDVSECVKAIKNIDHALTSEKEATALLKTRIAELGIIYDKATKAYVWKQTN